MRSLLLFVTVSFITVAGCGDSTSPTPSADAASDVTPDVAPDASPDVAFDVTRDASPDVAVDVTASDARADVTAVDAPADGGGATCGASSCAPSEICLRQRTLGGALLRPDDAGMCPAGRHPEGDVCVADFTYRCVARPTCSTADCACLGTLCPAAYQCRGAERSLLTCEQLAP